MRNFIGKHRLLNACVVMLTLLMGWSALSEYAQDKASNYHLANGVVRIQLPSGRKLNIPERYMYWEGYVKNGRWPQPKEGRIQVEAFNFDALLPDIRPFYEKDKAKWEVQGRGEKISIYLNENPDTPGSIKDKYISKVNDENKNYTKYIGIENKLISFVNYIKINNEIMPYGKTYFTANMDIKIDCNDLSVDLHSPSCNVWQFIGGDLFVDYTYSAKFFESWEDINNKILASLKNFENSARAESY